MCWIQSLDSASQMKIEWQTSVEEQARVKLYPFKARCDVLSLSLLNEKSIWPSQRSVPIRSGCGAENWRINRCYLSEEGHKECSGQKDTRKARNEEKVTELCREEEEYLVNRGGFSVPPQQFLACHLGRFLHWKIMWFDLCLHHQVRGQTEEGTLVRFRSVGR